MEKPKKNTTLKKRTLLTWTYDDCCTIGCVLEHKGNFSEAGLLKSETDRGKYIEKLAKKEKQGEWKIKANHIDDFPIGIELFSQVYKKNQKTPNLNEQHFREFTRMAQIDAGREIRLPVLQLISLILSAYLIQNIFEIKDDLDFYPIDDSDMRALYGTISHHENTFYALRKSINR